MRVAIMQPYFAPYAGYYRLYAAVDLFVAFDCVQFPRRGWVHRNRLPRADGALDWLTLPLAKAPVDTAISELRFAADAVERFAVAARRFPALGSAGLDGLPLFEIAPGGNLVDYLERLDAAIRERLGLASLTVRSSSLAIDPALRGPDRILAIARAVGATDYVNAPGGRALYDPDAFAAAGIALSFLSPYAPDHPDAAVSILHRLATQDPEALRAEILSQTTLSA